MTTPINMQDFIFEGDNKFFESNYNDYGLRCEVTMLEPKKYRVELVALDCKVVKLFICKSTKECKSAAYEEAKFLKEMNEMTVGNFSVDNYELHHSWAYADSSDIERLKEHCSKYDENYNKCELDSAYEEQNKTGDEIKDENFERLSSKKQFKLIHNFIKEQD